MKKFILVALSIVFSTLLIAKIVVNGPVMTFEKKSHDFGDVKQGGKVTHVFKYKNTGNDTLRIDNVISSCGCTVPNNYEKVVAPGASGSIAVSFNSEGKMGVVNKTLTILSNAVTGAEEPAEYLTIRVNVIP
ncbi:DUF1573 domain-containing protein [Cytophaga hutchinsonii]|uniref:DUF1573 domain-containing protein n=1 Tax=Cytophaga hutchinsonii (strain ATCC 33406 / DSM 1761 / CIP 103989 / NBRC 15051 / NCIMB 9469 / D465) TaxID=269798 RepID=A0A6N4SUK8_CYTH3|nr:DUF1573 domain-containing protein [Cytophaga hutchinsonii]ABG59915.1 conserved hypothetical protein [Cytophaga hutchinsonii ATCC 33406]SFX27473.1 Protein of unknown function [Cytophaga hutchinsonii ATCC 33406]